MIAFSYFHNSRKRFPAEWFSFTLRRADVWQLVQGGSVQWQQQQVAMPRVECISSTRNLISTHTLTLTHPHSKKGFSLFLLLFLKWSQEKWWEIRKKENSRIFTILIVYFCIAFLVPIYLRICCNDAQNTIPLVNPPEWQQNTKDYSGSRGGSLLSWIRMRMRLVRMPRGPRGWWRRSRMHDKIKRKLQNSFRWANNSKWHCVTKMMTFSQFHF